ncbi:hypothetical protein ACJZ2D_009784 [Fusarium nematophilum]
MEWFGKAQINFTHAPSPLALREKNGKQTDLLKVCEKITPPCQMNPLLFNGHVQAMWTAMETDGPAVYYRRRTFQGDHNPDGTFAVDFVSEEFHEIDDSLPPRTRYMRDEEFNKLASDDDRPQLVILHGLSGGSFEIYLRHAIAPLIKDGTWEICVVNARGCANSKITSNMFFNARGTWDFRQTVKWLKKTFPNRPLFGLGFSIGGNILTNYLGEEGSDCPLKAAIACSNPFNLEVANKALKATLIGREVYLRALATNLKELFKGHKDAIQKYTELDYDHIQSVTYLHEFDRAVQCPSFGYPTEDTYYRDASCSDAILAIRIPYLAINATDDPIAVDGAIPYQEFKANPYTVLCTTSLGGHLGWFEPGGGRWHAKPVTNFLNHMAFNVNLDKVNAQVNGNSNGVSKKRSLYAPMRRKMDMRAELGVWDAVENDRPAKCQRLN